MYKLTERLKGKKTIDQLFKKGKRLKIFPLILIYVKTELEYNHIGVSVPKRKIALAVERNRLKRQMREAIRLNSEIERLEHKYNMMWIYTDKSTSCDFKTFQRSVHQIIQKLKKNE